jgi:hypothetical protein
VLVETSFLGCSGLLEMLFPLSLEEFEADYLNMGALGLNDFGSSDTLGKVGAIIHSGHTDFDLLLRINHL